MTHKLSQFILFYRANRRGPKMKSQSSVRLSLRDARKLSMQGKYVYHPMGYKMIEGLVYYAASNINGNTRALVNYPTKNWQLELEDK